MFLGVFLSVYVLFALAMLIILPMPEIMRGAFKLQLLHASSIAVPIAACCAILVCALYYLRLQSRRM